MSARGVPDLTDSSTMTPVTPKTVTPTVPTSNVTVSATKLSSWGSGVTGGYNGEFDIVNDNDYDILNWTMTYDCPQPFTWFSEGDVTRTAGGGWTLVPKEWNQKIPAKTTKKLGFGGTTALPTSVTFHQVLPLVGADPTEKTRGTWGEKIVAPYVDACAYPMIQLQAMSKASGLKYFTMAFVVADQKGKPAWGGTIPMENQYLLDQIRQIRAIGGDVSISFGGANGIELAQAITDVPTLVAAYKEVIDLYTLSRIDFDIEGGAVADAPSIDRRNAALTIIQSEYPKLQITYCLPVLPTGLTADGVALIENAKMHGVNVWSFNGMSMDFGDSAAPPSGKMGDYVIQSTKSIYAQAQAAGFASPRAGTIAMIGINDVESEVFGLDDAVKVRDFFVATPWMDYVGFWSVNRDRDDGSRNANGAASGIAQKPYDFSKIFLGGSAPPTVPVVPTKPPTKIKTNPDKIKPPPVPVKTPVKPPPTPPTPPTPVIAAMGKKTFAPYAESWLTKWNGSALWDVPAKHVTLAFVLSAGGVPKFDGSMDLKTFVDATKKIRAKGGDIRISFGGASGTELALAITDVDVLATAYRKVIDAYDATWLDFDIEGAPTADHASIDRRNAAIAKIQASHPGLKIDYTLAVMPTGLDATGLNILVNAKKHGVVVNAVNLMAMDYSSEKIDMGDAAISAAKATKTQLDARGISASIGLTPMIGVNDTGEVFTMADATKVVNFATSQPWISFLSFWALGRDNPKQSGIAQKPWDFTTAFLKFES